VKNLEELVQRIAYNDLPHIQAKLSAVEAQGRITLALVVGLIMVVMAGGLTVLFGR
tara:strand:- start:907 stop:1074 length:168 start_codon:yes stop_codon:yes gene_type:complete